MRVLLTGFEPFGGHSENSSWVVAEAVASQGVEGANIVLEQMPVSFMRAGASLRKAVEECRPECIVMLGQTGVSDCVKLERVALNLMDSTLADNDGYKANEETIHEGMPLAFITPLPIKALCSAVKAQGVAAKISNSCGLYVCNRLYYEALAMCSESDAMQAIFVHLPLYDGHPSVKEGQATMPRENMIKAIQTIIEEICQK